MPIKTLYDDWWITNTTYYYRQDNKKPKARPPDWAYHFEEANKGIS